MYICIQVLMLILIQIERRRRMGQNQPMSLLDDVESRVFSLGSCQKERGTYSNTTHNTHIHTALSFSTKQIPRTLQKVNCQYKDNATDLQFFLPCDQSLHSCLEHSPIGLLLQPASTHLIVLLNGQTRWLVLEGNGQVGGSCMIVFQVGYVSIYMFY